MYMMVCGATANATVKEGPITITGLTIRVIGRMTPMTDLEFKHGRKDIDMRGNLYRELDRGKDNFSGLMEVNMRAILIKTELRAMVY